MLIIIVLFLVVETPWLPHLPAFMFLQEEGGLGRDYTWAFLVRGQVSGQAQKNLNRNFQA
jgi:hypothetical protein